MRIPGGGDLMPARRRRYGGGYGRRRRRRSLRFVLGLLLVAGAAGAAYELRQDDSRAARLTTSPTACPTTEPTAAALVLPAPRQVRLEVLNGTSKVGLAKTVADELAALGFVVTGQGNAPAALAGSPVVSFGTGGEAAGTLVSHWLPSSQLKPAAGLTPGSVRVVLGSGFLRIATPAEAAAAGQRSPAPVVTRAACAA